MEIVLNCKKFELFSNNMIYLIPLISLVSIFIYLKIIRPASYWKRKGVKQGREIYFLGDNSGNILQKFSLATLVEHNYNKFSNERYCGLYQFQKPTLMIRDPELLKELTVKGFDHFCDHVNVLPNESIWSKNLFALKGQDWRDMRSTLSPVFTSSKMRAMFSLMNDCAENVVNYLYKKSDTIETYDTKDLFTRYANDVIATCAFGVTCNSLEDRENEFYRMGKLLSDFTSPVQMLKFAFQFTMPKLYKLFGVTLFNKKVKIFFTDLVTNTIKIREEQNIIRPDLIHLLMEARKGRLHHIDESATAKEAGFAIVEESEVGKKLHAKRGEITDEDIIAQAVVFFFAGFDSVSSVMCFMAQELAMNLDIEDRLRQEVDETLLDNNGIITYETLSKMQYMDMVLSETLRLWPAGPVVDRLCVQPFTLKAEKPSEVDVQLDKDDILWIPIFGLHRDAQYYPNPTKFDPERFNAGNKHKIKPFTYLPFGAGPRACVGSRFALMEVKLIFVHLLSKFTLEVVEKTQIPIVMSKKSAFSMIPENGFWLGLQRRT